jgi:YidC/Oxa1 family membrane protein insertase
MPETNGKGKKELSMEMRLLIAFLLMGLVLFVTPYLYKGANTPGPKGPQNITPQKAAELTKPPAPAPPVAPQQLASENSAAPQQAAKEETFVVDTALFRATFSNKGASVRSWVLKKYKDLDGKPLELVNQVALAKVPAPFSFDFKDQKPAVDLAQALFIARPAPDNLGVDYEYSDGKLVARKSFRFRSDSYLAQVTSEVIQNGAQIPHVLAWRGGFGDPTIRNAASAERNVYYNDGRLQTKTAKDAKNGPVSVSGGFGFAGIEDSFFAAVYLPRGTGNVELITYSDSVPVPPDNKETSYVGAGVGSGGVNELALFVGPKDTDILRKVDPRLAQLIDWGRWFGFIAKPLFYALNWTNDRITHNFGWAIVLVTIAINILTFPFRLTSLKSSKKMQALQPEIQRINEKYKGLSIRDPKKAEQNQEMMALYKKYGVNPVGGCAPMLLQIPFFIAYYTVLTVAIELRGASWLWVSDLSRPEQLAIRILPVLLIVTQFMTQRMTPPSPGVDPAQQKMMMFMPLVLGFMFYYASAGLVLYWLTGNLVAIVQQWIMNRTMKTPVILPTAKPVSKARRRA